MAGRRRNARAEVHPARADKPLYDLSGLLAGVFAEIKGFSLRTWRQPMDRLIPKSNNRLAGVVVVTQDADRRRI